MTVVHGKMTEGDEVPALPPGTIILILSGSQM
jgi:hypothetical protein